MQANQYLQAFFLLFNCQTPVEKLLVTYNQRVKDLLKNAKSDYAKVEWFEIRDFNLPMRRFENKIVKICKGFGKHLNCNKAILKEYFFEVKGLYKVYWKYRKIVGKSKYSEEKIKIFLGKVYESYNDNLSDKKREEYREFLNDTEDMFFIRNAGMLEKEGFCNCIWEVFRDIRSSQVQQAKLYRSVTYRESSADLIMAASLQLTGFGYCRQVLQTISDAQMARQDYEYDNINYNRFRIVAAVLISVKGKRDPIQEGEEYLVDGTELIDEGKKYCKGTLKCILGKLLGQKSIKEDPEKEKLAQGFVGNIYKQIEEGIGKFQKDIYENTLLYVFLHGEKEDMNKELLQMWRRYEVVASECNGFRHIFWRLEAYCIGVNKILSNGQIIVERDFFEHMSIIYQRITKDDQKKGCIWESGLWDCMWEVKKDVGDFYNNPDAVYTKTSQEKLENTIEFIQNYYYHNRIHIVKEGGFYEKESGSEG